MRVNDIKQITDSQVRIFSLQTRDPSFILFPDLPSAYLINTLIQLCSFKLRNIKVEYVYPFSRYVEELLSNMEEYREDYFVFFLENYYHSSDFGLGFLEEVLKKISKKEWKKPKIFIHSHKISKDIAQDILDRYGVVICIIRTDVEYFFFQLFSEKKSIENISNILFRDDGGNVHINEEIEVSHNLWNYILWAYYNGYHTQFSKSKEKIISYIDEDTDETDESLYYRRSKNTIINDFRHNPEVEIMLTSGRGCRYNCSYCYRGAKYHTERQISLDILKRDLDYLHWMKYEYIYFYDDCFITTNLHRLDGIIALLSKYNFSYGISARYEVCTNDALMRISKLNIKRIQIGLQSVSIGVNKETNRWFQKEKFTSTIEKIKNLWIDISLDIILGLPSEGLSWFLSTFRYAISLNPYSIFINTLFLNPGTELYKKRHIYKIRVEEELWKESLFHVPGIISSQTFSQKDMQIAKKYVSYYIKKLKTINIILR